MDSSTRFQLQFFRLHPGAKAPERSHAGDLGYDLSAVEPVRIAPGERQLVATGLSLVFPEGWGGIIKDRSSMAVKGIHALAGVIDNGYRGEVKVVLANLGDCPFEIEAGQRIAQLIPTAVTDWELVERDEHDDGTSRGTGGFGSSGS